MGSEPRHPVEGEDWTFTIHYSLGTHKTKTVHVLGYHEPSHTVWGIEKGDAHPTVYQPHQWRLWSPPKDKVPDFTRYIYVGKKPTSSWHPDGIGTSTRRERDLPLRHLGVYPFIIKLQVVNGKATATVLD